MFSSPPPPPGTRFQRVIPDKQCRGGEGVEKVLLCSGRVYYELVQERKERSLDDKVAILRVEQVKMAELLMAST